MPRFCLSRWASPAVLAAALLPLPATAAPAPAADTPAEKSHKALRKPADLEIAGPSLPEAVNQLRQQTGLNFVLDQSAVLNPLELAPTAARTAVIGQFHYMPLGKAVRELLRPYSLTCAVAGDTIWIAAPQVCVERQVEQMVSVEAKDLPLDELAGRLARETGVNIAIDRRVAKERHEKLTLHLQEVSLLTAVELIAADAGLQMVRLDNVLYVTTEQHAQSLQRSRKANRLSENSQSPAGSPTLPAGVRGGGIGGLGAMGGFNQLGMGGGVMGSFQGGAAPLTPPLPAKKSDAKKEEEKKKQPELKPGRGQPAPPRDTPRKPAAEAVLPERPALTVRQRRPLQ